MQAAVLVAVVIVATLAVTVYYATTLPTEGNTYYLLRTTTSYGRSKIGTLNDTSVPRGYLYSGPKVVRASATTALAPCGTLNLPFDAELGDEIRVSLTSDAKVGFYVMNDALFNSSRRTPCNIIGTPGQLLVRRDSTFSFSLNFTVPEPGVYHFLFLNFNRPTDANMNFEAEVVSRAVYTQVREVRVVTSTGTSLIFHTAQPFLIANIWLPVAVVFFIIPAAAIYLVRRKSKKFPQLSDIDAEKLVPGSTVIFDTFGNARMQILETLEGGMGKVYVCADKNNQKFALKTYKYATGGTENLRRVNERFYHEAVSWVGLGKHPNIVRALTFAKMRDTPFLLLEFIDGGNLRQLMEGGRLDFTKTVRLADNISSGMSYAHSRKLVHRDLKPENILIDKNGVAKVTDFGLARVIEEASGTMSQDLSGTLPYMSPEQFLPAPIVDQRVDVYSFGVMLYEMLTGKKPFPAETIPQLIAAHRECIPTPPSTHVVLPNWIDRLVLRCLEKNPEKRFQNFNEILETMHRSHNNNDTT